MSEDQTRRSTADTPDSPASEPDSLVSALRSIPRLRSIEEEAPGKVKRFRPVPPMACRIGGMSQGCGGLLVSVIGVIMLLAALWYGFYLWGPGLLLGAGLVLIAATLGVWRGQRVPIVVSIGAVIVAAVIGLTWESFIMVAGRLSPLGQAGVLLGPATSLVALILLVTLAANIISLVYWRRLLPSTRRGVAVWGFGVLALVFIAVMLHTTQQQQRKAWMQDQLDTWRPDAVTDTLTLGSTLNVTLGYSFLTVDEGEDDRLATRIAELQAAIDAGADILRVTASGDVLLEEQQPRLFNDDDSDEGRQKAQNRLLRYTAAELAYMTLVQQSGAALLLADYQYSPYLMLRSYEDKVDIPWDEFITLHTERIRHYAAQYQPDYYEIVNEPAQYTAYSRVAAPKDTDLAEAWVAHIQDLAAVVLEVSPQTQVGVAIALGDELDATVYQQLLQSDAIDFFGFRTFQPGAFAAIEDLFEVRGYPSAAGKAAWILETWYGACLAPQRSQELDGDWLELTAAFAAKEGMAGVLASDFGCFVKEGGTVFGDAPGPRDRTAVWERWRDLVVQWRAS